MKTYTAENLITDGVIGIKERSGEKNCALHSHDFIEIVYISDGEATQTVDGVEYSVRRGDMLFINCAATHAFFSEKAFDYVEIFFSPKLVAEGVVTPDNALALLSFSSFNDMRGGHDGGKLSFSSNERAEIEFILSAMLREQKAGLVSSDTVMASYLNILLTKMCRKASAANENIVNDIWNSLKSYIDECPEEHITLSSLAAKSFYNPSYFSRAFKQKFGMSPVEYIRDKRIDKAIALLISDNISIDEIIENVGFSDRSAFYHCFSKKTGMTPSEYRIKIKGKKTTHSE